MEKNKRMKPGVKKEWSRVELQGAHLSRREITVDERYWV